MAFDMNSSSPLLAKAAAVACALLLSACPTEPDRIPPVEQWTQVVSTPQAALLSVHGTTNANVWMVGADDGSGPLVLRWDGTTWPRKDTGVEGDLWWVHTFFDGTALLAPEMRPARSPQNATPPPENPGRITQQWHPGPRVVKDEVQAVT